jgi:diguanylate cyclase (GGDEF)-like protein
MNSSIFQNVPKCTFDHPLEFTPSEIGSLANSINVLLKTTFLIGTSRDMEGTFQSLFDIAEEIAGIECGAYFSEDQASGRLETVVSRRVPPKMDQDPSLFAPAEIARHFGKVIQLDAGKDPLFRSICETWQSASLAAFPLRLNREFIGGLVFGNKAPQPFTSAQMKLLWALSIQAENLLLQGEAVRTLSFYSSLDPLTHLYNRNYFNNQMEIEISRSRRNGKPFSLLMIDLDGFKVYNDRFLHSAGDIALQEFSSILQASVREVDTAARYGGDEFALILFESDAEGARDLARRIIERQKMHLVPGREGIRTERLSVSIGAATFPADSFDMQHLVIKANHALSMAKSRGGGKVCLYHEIADLLAVSSSKIDIPIQKIYGAARSIVDMDTFLEILLFNAMQGLSADRGSIVVTTPKGDLTLRAAIGFGKGEEKFTPGSTLTTGAVTNWVMEHREPLLVSGQGEMPLPKQQERNGYRSDSFLSVPLLHEGQMLGAIHLANKRDKKPFTREDLKIFKPISGEIARILSEGIAFRENVRSFSTSFLLSLSRALELRFPFLNGHNGRVVDLSVRIGKKIGLEGEELTALGTAAALHDVGIVGIPSSILMSNRKLSDTDLETTRKHPILGAKLVEGVPGMEETRRIILEHHEFWNGSGYPYGLKGEQISKAGRILSVVEFYDSITSERPYRGKLVPEEAVQLVHNSMDTLFDREVCLALLEGLKSVSTLSLHR